MQRQRCSPFTSTRGAGPGTLGETGMSATGLLFPFTAAIRQSLTTHLCQDPGFWMPTPAALQGAPDTASAPG